MPIIDCHVHLNYYSNIQKRKRIPSLKDRLTELLQTMRNNNIAYSLILTSYKIDSKRLLLPNRFRGTSIEQSPMKKHRYWTGDCNIAADPATIGYTFLNRPIGLGDSTRERPLKVYPIHRSAMFAE